MRTVIITTEETSHFEYEVEVPDDITGDDVHEWAENEALCNGDEPRIEVGFSWGVTGVNDPLDK